MLITRFIEEGMLRVVDPISGSIVVFWKEKNDLGKFRDQFGDKTVLFRRELRTGRVPFAVRVNPDSTVWTKETAIAVERLRLTAQL